MKHSNKHNLYLPCLTILAVALICVACSKDDTATLPDGKYPVTLNAIGLNPTPVTRATSDGSWTTDDEIAIQVGGGYGVKKYVPITAGPTVTLNAAVGVTPFYWQNRDDINVSAWYLGTGYNATLPTSWSVQTDQNIDESYQKSDFLYASGTIDFDGTKSLTFYHQTAKVVINIRNYDVVTDAEKIDSVKITSVLDGSISDNATEHYRLCADGGTYRTISANKLASPNTGVAFEGAPETALASFQALVIPQTLSINTPIEIKINGYDTFSFTPVGEWNGGNVYTYNITIKGRQVTVNTNTDIGWITGGSGTGSGEI